MRTNRVVVENRTRTAAVAGSKQAVQMGALGFDYVKGPTGKVWTDPESNVGEGMHASSLS